MRGFRRASRVLHGKTIIGLLTLVCAPQVIAQTPPAIALIGVWRITVVAKSSSERQDSVVGALLFNSDEVTGRLTTGEQRVNMAQLLGFRPACVPEHGDVLVGFQSWSFNLNLAPGAADCGLILEGRFIGKGRDSASGAWHLPSFAGWAGSGSWHMERLFDAPLPEGERHRGLGRTAWAPIHVGGEDSAGTQRIETYIRGLRWLGDTLNVPVFRLIGRCCGANAPDNGPFDAYEVSWTFGSPPSERSTWVDTLYFARFPMPRHPIPYNDSFP